MFVTLLTAATIAIWAWVILIASYRIGNWLCWRILARVLCRPTITAWILRKAEEINRPIHLSGYMSRWWLFNAPPRSDAGEHRNAKWWPLPSIRVHHILRPDKGRAEHDHPWNARTIILKGYYGENRDGIPYVRCEGDTVQLRHGEFHRITFVPPQGAVTLFIMWRYRGPWGFKVPSWDYDKAESYDPSRNA